MYNKNVKNNNLKEKFSIFLLEIVKLIWIDMEKERETQEPVVEETTEVVVKPTDNAVETPDSGKPETTPTSRDNFIGKLKSKYTDKTYDNDEDVYADALSYLSEMEATTKEAEKFKNDLIAVFEENPIISVLIKRTKEMDGDFMAALQTLVSDPSDLTLREGDEGYDRAREYMNNRAKMDLEQEEIRNKWNANSERLPAVIQDWADKNGISDEDLDKFVDFITSFATRVVMGDIDETVLNQIYKSYTYDEKVGETMEDNRIAAENIKPAPKEVPTVPMPTNQAPQPRTKTPKQNSSFEDVFGL